MYSTRARTGLPLIPLTSYAWTAVLKDMTPACNNIGVQGSVLRWTGRRAKGIGQIFNQLCNRSARSHPHAPPRPHRIAPSRSSNVTTPTHDIDVGIGDLCLALLLLDDVLLTLLGRLEAIDELLEEDCGRARSAPSTTGVAEVAAGLVDVFEVRVVEGHPPQLIVLSLPGRLEVFPESIAVCAWVCV